MAPRGGGWRAAGFNLAAPSACIVAEAASKRPGARQEDAHRCPLREWASMGIFEGDHPAGVSAFVAR